MVVIARFPRLDPTVAAACPAVPVVGVVAPTTTANAAAEVMAAVLPTVLVGAAVTRGARSPRVRFPAVSTLVLAVVAGMLWVAVWRDEQRRAAEDADRDREAVAREPYREAGLFR